MDGTNRSSNNLEKQASRSIPKLAPKKPSAKPKLNGLLLPPLRFPSHNDDISRSLIERTVRQLHPANPPLTVLKKPPTRKRTPWPKPAPVNSSRNEGARTTPGGRERSLSEMLPPNRDAIKQPTGRVLSFSEDTPSQESEDVRRVRSLTSAAASIKEFYAARGLLNSPPSSPRNLQNLRNSQSPQSPRSPESKIRVHQQLSPRRALKDAEENFDVQIENAKGSARGIRAKKPKRVLVESPQKQREDFKNNKITRQTRNELNMSQPLIKGSLLELKNRLLEDAFAAWDYPIPEGVSYNYTQLDRMESGQVFDGGKINTVHPAKFRNAEGIIERICKKETILNPELEHVILLEIDPKRPMLLQRNLAFAQVCQTLDLDLAPQTDAGTYEGGLYTVMSIAPGEPGAGNKDTKRVYLSEEQYHRINEAVKNLSGEDFERECENSFNLVKARIERDKKNHPLYDEAGRPVITYKANMPADNPISNPKEESLKQALILLQIIDYILGQTDRHLDNLYVEVKKIQSLDFSIIHKFKKLTGIDNDFCLGKTAYTPEYLAKCPFSNAAELPPHITEEAMRIIEKLGSESASTEPTFKYLLTRLATQETVLILEKLPNQQLPVILNKLRAVQKNESLRPRNPQEALSLFKRLFNEDAYNVLENIKEEIIVKEVQGRKVTRNLKHHKIMSVFHELSDPKRIEIVTGCGSKQLQTILQNLGFSYDTIAAAQARYDYLMQHFARVRAGDLKHVEESVSNSYAFRFRKQYKINQKNMKLKSFEADNPKQEHSFSGKLRDSLTHLPHPHIKKPSPKKFLRALSKELKD